MAKAGQVKPGKSAAWTAQHDIHEAEVVLLQELRKLRRGAREDAKQQAENIGLSRGQRIADVVADTMGSWRFIIA